MTYYNLDEIVFDPFMGLGTTAIVAIQPNRPYWGIEMNEEYYRIALVRLKRLDTNY